MTPTALRDEAEMPAIACPNCGHAVVEQFCAGCGQENRPDAVSLRALVAEFLDNTLSWDSKIIRTLVPLLFRPGFLTSEYNAGRRVRYVSPFRTYLTATLIFSFVVALRPASPVTIHTGKAAGKAQAFGPMIEFGDETPATIAAYDDAQKKAKVKDPAWKQALMKRIVLANQKAKTDGGATLQKALVGEFIEDTPKALFVLLPLFAGLLRMTFRRQKHFYIAHLIFALHAHAFVFLMLTLALLLPVPGIWFALVGAVYLAVALRVVYKQGWILTLLKGFVLLNIYVILLALASAAVVFLAFWHL